MNDVVKKVLGVLAVAVFMAAAVMFVERDDVAKVGGRCSPDRVGQCSGPDRRLVCARGRWVEQPCRGPKGCQRGSSPKPSASAAKNRGHELTCDTSDNREGDACFGDAPRCAPDGKSVLACVGGKLALTACPEICVAGACE